MQSNSGFANELDPELSSLKRLYINYDKIQIKRKVNNNIYICLFVRVRAMHAASSRNKSVLIKYRGEVLSTVQGGQVLNQATCPGDNQAASNHPQHIQLKKKLHK